MEGAGTGAGVPVVESSGRWLLASWRRGAYAHALVTADKSLGSDALIAMVEGLDV